MVGWTNHAPTHDDIRIIDCFVSDAGEAGRTDLEGWKTDGFRRGFRRRFVRQDHDHRRRSMTAASHTRSAMMSAAMNQADQFRPN